MRKTVLLVMIAMCMNAIAQKVTIDKITYVIEKGEAYVRYADKDIEVANILSSVEYKGKSYPVTRIGKERRVGLTMESGFLKCSKLKSVSIPSSVTTLGIGAFAFCESLEEISIPNTVKSFSPSCLSSTPFKKIIIPDSPVEMRLSEFGGPFELLPVKESKVCNTMTEVVCQNGSYPLWFMPYLPSNCPFVLAQRYSQGGNNGNMYAQNVPQQQPIQPTPPQSEKKKPSSDVDVNLPLNAVTNDKTFAVIFANEKYQEEVAVEYAENDGDMFKEYCHKVLGLPVDGIGTEPETAYSLAKFYQTLGALPAENVTVFMDACFSGSLRGNGMLAIVRGVAIKAKAQTPL